MEFKLSGSEIDEDMRLLFDRYCADETKLIYEIPFSQTEPYNANAVLLGCVALQMVSIFKKKGIAVTFVLDYNGHEIILYKDVERMALPFKYTVEIPYAEHDKYLRFAQEVSKIIPSNGVEMLFVSGNPYELAAYLVIETDRNQKQVEELINEYGLATDNSKGLTEFWEEMKYRKWNCRVIPQWDDDLIGMLYQSEFRFVPKSELEGKGYHPECSKARKRLFVSYCHADKEVVSRIVSVIKSHGYYYWWDEQEIDAGDSILESVLEGVKECDLALVFISKSTPERNFAKFELRTFWQELIGRKKSWFIVRLDDVDPETIYSGLSGYKYIDYRSDQDINHLLDMLQRKMSRVFE